MKKLEKIENIKSKALHEKNDFVDFIRMYNLPGVTVGFILGSAGKDLVTSLSTNIFMPFVGLLTPSGSWREIAVTVGKTQFKIGESLSSVLDFIIIAGIVFILMKKVFKLEKQTEAVK